MLDKVRGARAIPQTPEMACASDRLRLLRHKGRNGRSTVRDIPFSNVTFEAYPLLHVPPGSRSLGRFVTRLDSSVRDAMQQ